MRIGDIAFWVFLILMIVVPIGLGIHFVVLGYPMGAYDIRRAGGSIDRAISVTDLNEQNHYLEMALEDLEGYHGNPSWWFPTIATNYDAIRGNIESCVERNTEVAVLNATDYTYQRLVENNLRTYPEINNALFATISWQVIWNLTNVVIFALWVIGWVGFFLYVLVS